MHRRDCLIFDIPPGFRTWVRSLAALNGRKLRVGSVGDFLIHVHNLLTLEGVNLLKVIVGGLVPIPQHGDPDCVISVGAQFAFSNST